MASGTGIAELRKLADRDADLAARAGRLYEEQAAVAAIRTRAEAIDGFLTALPVEEERRGEAVDEAQTELERRRAELAAAERAAGEAREGEERERAERAVARARDHVTSADSRLTRERSAQEELAAQVEELAPELARLEDEARALAAAAPYLPAPAPGTPGLLEWTSHAAAELFVATSQIDRQRELVIREASELATALLGEPAYGSTPAQALRRVERAR